MGWTQSMQYNSEPEPKLVLYAIQSWLANIHARILLLFFFLFGSSQMYYQSDVLMII